MFCARLDPARVATLCVPHLGENMERAGLTEPTAALREQVAALALLAHEEAVLLVAMADIDTDPHDLVDALSWEAVMRSVAEHDQRAAAGDPGFYAR